MITQERFDELAREHGVPGAVLAIGRGAELHEFATGVLNIETGVATTGDSLFQLASITKPYTATMVMRLVQQGRLTLDTPVVDVLPDFALADPETAAKVTVRHLLNHTSGIAGDFYPEPDTGRGDDALAKYVALCAEVGQDTPLGAVFSYSNTGYNILGRMIEVLTGQTWEQALADLVTGPLGVTRTWALPEQVLRFRAAMGHCRKPAEGDPLRVVQAPMWEPGSRADNPCGGLCATAADVIAFARLHLTDAGLAVLREPSVEVPSPLASHWGLGWRIQEWSGGRRVFGHGGDVIGQSGQLYVSPDDDLAVVVLTNIDASTSFVEAVVTEVFTDLCGITPPERPAPPADPRNPADPDRYTGTYTRVGSEVTVSRTEAGGLYLDIRFTGTLGEYIDPFGFPLIPLSDTLFVGREDGGPWRSVVLADGYAHFGVRAYRLESAH